MTDQLMTTPEDFSEETGLGLTAPLVSRKSRKDGRNLRREMELDFHAEQIPQRPKAPSGMRRARRRGTLAREEEDD